MTFGITTAMAAEDSVGVFHNPGKVIVLINEINGAPRINGLMDALGVEMSFLYESADGLVRIQCGTPDDKAGCTFRVYEGGDIGTIGHRNAEALIPASELGVRSNYEMYFESSRQDKFYLKVDSKGLWFFATKKN